MSGSVNKVILLARLGADPEQRNFQNGGSVVNMRVATSETWRDKNTGEKQERSQWHSVAIFSEPVGKIAMQYLKKGSQVYLEGQLETRKYQDQSGADRYSTEVVLRPFNSTLTLLGGKSDSAGSRPDSGGYEDKARQAPSGGYSQGGSALVEDSIPFAPEWR